MNDPALMAAGLVGVAGVATVAAGAFTAAAQRRRTADGLIGPDGVVDLTDPTPGPEAITPTTFEGRLALPFAERVVLPRVRRVVALVSSVTPADRRARIRSQLAAAGLDFQRRPEEIVAMQGVGALVGFVLASLLWLGGVGPPTLRLAVTIAMVAGGAAAPLLWLSRQVDARARAIRDDLPDTLDLLAISVEAGVGLEGAFQVVTERFESPLADEMARVLQEMGLGLSRRDALANLKQRAAVPELASFVSALIQADLLGMPLGTVLKVQAGDMRAKRRQWARERAAKLPVKILFPLVVCIFPAVLVVVLGPAMSQIGEALK